PPRTLHRSTARRELRERLGNLSSIRSPYSGGRAAAAWRADSFNSPDWIEISATIPLNERRIIIQSGGRGLDPPEVSRFIFLHLDIPVGSIECGRKIDREVAALAARWQMRIIAGRLDYRLRRDMQRPERQPGRIHPELLSQRTI